MKKLLLSLLAIYASTAHAGFMIETMSGFNSSSDSNTSTTITDSSNHIFVAASLGQKARLYIGQNISLISQQIKTTNTNKISTTELGPRMTYFFSDDNMFYFTAAWNPYAKGTRTVSSVSSDISGWSYLAGLGAELKVNRAFKIGGSLNYHALNVTKSIDSSNVATEVSHSYTSLMPMINLCLSFH
jgi:hypothetical protein